MVLGEYDMVTRLTHLVLCVLIALAWGAKEPSMRSYIFLIEGALVVVSLLQHAALDSNILELLRLDTGFVLEHKHLLFDISAILSKFGK